MAVKPAKIEITAGHAYRDQDRDESNESSYYEKSKQRCSFEDSMTH